MNLHGTCISSLPKDTHFHHLGVIESTLSGPVISGGCVPQLCLFVTVKCILPSHPFLSPLSSTNYFTPPEIKARK